MPKHFYHVKPFPVLDTPFHHTPGFCPAPGGPGVGLKRRDERSSPQDRKPRFLELGVTLRFFSSVATPKRAAVPVELYALLLQVANSVTSASSATVRSCAPSEMPTKMPEVTV